MADFNSTSPDIYHQVNSSETPTHYERRLDSFPNVSEKTGKVIIDTEKNIATILVPSETKQETKALNEDFKQKFIEKLKKLPNFEGSKIQEAIENGKIKTFDIPGSEKIAISLNGNNIDYIFNLDGTEYFDFQWRRSNGVRYSAYKGVMPDGYKEISENGIFYLIKGSVKLDSFSKDGLSSYSSIAEYIKGLVNWLNEAGQMDWDTVVKEEKN